MQYRKYLARAIGAVATWLYSIAERLDENWDSEWVAIRDAVRRRYAELDEGWDLPLPGPPRLPTEVDDDRRSTDRCIETPPPPLPQAERRTFVVNGKLESVRPTRSDKPTWWMDWGGRWGRS